MPKIRLSIAAWPAWIALTAAMTARPFLWHLEYFHHPGAEFFSLYLGALAFLIAAAFFYIRLRQRRPVLIGWEPRAFAGFFLAVFLFYAPLPTLYSLWILFVCFGLGRLALGGVAGSALEQLTLWPAAGLGFLSALLFLMGLARLYYRWLALALLGLAAIALWRNTQVLWRLLRRAEAGYAACAGDPRWGLCLVFTFVFSIASAMVALSPEIAFDPVSFHFVLARDYAAMHRLAVIPHLPYSYFPQNVEVLYSLGFLLEGQSTAKLLTYAFFPLAATTVTLIARSWFQDPGKPAAFIAAALFTTTPFIAWTGSVAKNDLALALYILLALYGVVRWTEGGRFPWLAAGVLFLGFAFGVKHVAILGAAPLAALVFWNLRRVRLTARQVVILAAIFVFCGLYWHARTFLLTGNPLYPEMGASAIRSATAAGHPQLGWPARLGIFLSTPWRIHFDGLHAFESPSPNPAGFFLVAFFPLFWTAGGVKTRGARLCLVFCGAYFLYWAVILIKVRYAIAAFGVLFAYLAGRMCAARRGPVLALETYCLLFSLTATLILEVNVPRLKFFARRIGREEFLRETLVPYRSIEALNRAAKPGEKAYSVGNCSTFYANIEFHCYYDYQGNYSLQQIGQDLRGVHYQYFLVSNEWVKPSHMHMVEHIYYPLLIYEDESFRLYRLRWQDPHHLSSSRP
jgi:4-amino-4-deoxy-L-arabinose transferase-like glycosyltransferase